MSGRKPIDGRSGVFIDFSNLFWQIKIRDKETGERQNFDISYRKLKTYLDEQHSPVFYNLYACHDLRPSREPYITRAIKHKKFLNRVAGIGYNVITKELKHIGVTAKCDTDVEITMDLHKHSPDIDNIILFSGDSDFLEAVKHFQSIGKYIHIYSFKSGLAWELKLFAMQNPRCNFTFLDGIKDNIEKEKLLTDPH